MRGFFIKDNSVDCYLLPDLDSNQDKQSQSLSYYRYTIRQCFKKIEAAKIMQIDIQSEKNMIFSSCKWCFLPENRLILSRQCVSGDIKSVVFGTFAIPSYHFLNVSK